MLCYDRIDASEEINVKKASESKEFHICYKRYFLNKGSKLQPYV